MIIIALWNIEFHVCFDFVKDIGLEMWNVSQRAPTVSSWSCCQLPPTWASGGKNPVISRIITILRELLSLISLYYFIHFKLCAENILLNLCPKK